MAFQLFAFAIVESQTEANHTQTFIFGFEAVSLICNFRCEP